MTRVIKKLAGNIMGEIIMKDKLLEMVPVPLSYMTIMIREITHSEQEVAELLQGTGIEPSSLLDPDCTITLAQQLKLFEKAAKQDAGIALALGLKANILTHGPLGQAMLSSETFRDALKVLCKYAKTRNPVVQYDFKETSNLAVLEFSQMVDLKGARILYTEGSMATVKTFLKFFLAEKFKDINFYDHQGTHKSGNRRCDLSLVTYFGRRISNALELDCFPV